MEVKKKVKREPIKLFSKDTLTGLFIKIFIFLMILPFLSFVLSLFGIVSGSLAGELIGVSFIFLCIAVFFMLFGEGLLKIITFFPRKLLFIYSSKPDLDFGLRLLLFFSISLYYICFVLIRNEAYYSTYFIYNREAVSNPYWFFGSFFIFSIILYCKVKRSHLDGYLLSWFEKFFLIVFPLSVLVILFVFFDSYFFLLNLFDFYI